MNGGTTMLMKTCIAAAVALGCTLAVPGSSFAAGDKDKSATSGAAEPNSANPSKATAHHKKVKKGHADEVHSLPYYNGGQPGETQQHAQPPQQAR
jgi:hypothetical protein